MTVELKPCPFCKGKARLSKFKAESLWSRNIVDWFQVSCSNEACETQQPAQCNDLEEAVSRWNLRRRK